MARRTSAPGRRTRPAAEVTAGRRALGEVDGVRGQRRGRGPEARARSRQRSLLVGAIVVTVIAVGVLFVAVAPVTTYRTQRQANTQAEAELTQVKAERARVKRETELLESDAEIERRAREKFGYQRPGEETFNLLPAPADPIGLPEGWPFTGLERALSG